MLLSVPESKVPCGVYCTKKCFKPDVGFGGTVFASNETVKVLADGREIVVQLQGFWSFQIDENCYILLGYGVLFPYRLLESGRIDTQYWSGFAAVLSQPLQETVIFTTDNILRKVIHYDNDDASFTVVDYMRQLGPKELTVPIFPEKNDMVLIQGEGIGTYVMAMYKLLITFNRVWKFTFLLQVKSMKTFLSGKHMVEVPKTKCHGIQLSGLLKVTGETSHLGFKQ